MYHMLPLQTIHQFSVAYGYPFLTHDCLKLITFVIPLMPNFIAVGSHLWQCCPVNCKCEPEDNVELHHQHLPPATDCCVYQNGDNVWMCCVSGLYGERNQCSTMHHLHGVVFRPRWHRRQSQSCPVQRTCSRVAYHLVVWLCFLEYCNSVFVLRHWALLQTSCSQCCLFLVLLELWFQLFSKWQKYFISISPTNTLYVFSCLTCYVGW